MNPYRQNAKPIELSVRWGVTKWKKMYVKVARIFFDLRDKYSYQRKYNQYLRDLAEWKRNDLRGWYYGWGVPNHIPPSYERFKYLKRHHGSRMRPMPLPPPIRIYE